MKELLQTIAHNYVTLNQEHGKLELMRFTPAQLAFYESQGHGFLLRASGPSCVTFDFLTDASDLKLEYDSKTLLPHFIYGAFDLYVDGVFTASTPCGEGTNLTWEYHFESRTMRRITLYLPFSRKLQFSNLDFGGAVVLPVHHAHTVFFFGDSITMGNMTQFPSMQYINLLAGQLDLEVRNQGVGCFYYDSASLDQNLGCSPDVIVAAYGTNDYDVLHGDPVRFQAHVQAYFDRLSVFWPQTPILVITPLWRADRSETISQAWRSVLCSVCAQYDQATVLDGSTLVPHITDFFADRVLHPNDLGNCLLAQNLLREISGLLPN